MRMSRSATRQEMGSLQISHTFTRLGLLIVMAFVGAVGAQDVDLDFAVSVGGSGYLDSGVSIAVDDSGNVYTAGIFEDTVDFDPGEGTFFLTSVGHEDIFVQKLDSSGNFVWAGALGGETSEFTPDIAVDGLGNMYITGGFNYKSDFDPGPGVHELQSLGGHDVFVLKLDSAGNLAWVAQMGDGFSSQGTSIVVDDAGSVVVTGSFDGTVDFDPGPGDFLLSAPRPDDWPDYFGFWSPFVLKFDGDGSFVWANSFDGLGRGEEIAIDSAGNVYCVGSYYGTIDLDPGVGTHTFTSVGHMDIFVTKLTATGELVWSKSFGNEGNDFGRGVAVDSNGNVYITGQSEGTADCIPDLLADDSDELEVADVFMVKLAPDGAHVWTQSMGCMDSVSWISVPANKFVVDATGNVYRTGSYWGRVDFDPGPRVVNLPNTGTLPGGYLQKLDTDGKFVWAKSMGGRGQGEAIALDDSGSVYATGYFIGAVDFDPGTGTRRITSRGRFDAFVVKLSLVDRKPAVIAEVLHDLVPSSYQDGEGGLDFQMASEYQPSLTRFQFDDWDANDDGLLSRDELAARVNDVYGCYASRESVSNGIQQNLGDVFILGLAFGVLGCGRILYREEHRDCLP